MKKKPLTITLYVRVRNFRHGISRLMRSGGLSWNCECCTIWLAVLRHVMAGVVTKTQYPTRQSYAPSRVISLRNGWQQRF